MFDTLIKNILIGQFRTQGWFFLAFIYHPAYDLNNPTGENIVEC